MAVDRSARCQSRAPTPSSALMLRRYTLRLPVSSSPPAQPPPLAAPAAKSVRHDELSAALALSLESSSPDALTVRMMHPHGSSKVSRALEACFEFDHSNVILQVFVPKRMLQDIKVDPRY